ncbi:MAG: hypothetical protein R3D44_01900 [Hyphomicrobiaceae bacterium]
MRRQSLLDTLPADRAAAWSLMAPVVIYLSAFAAMTSPWLLGRVSIPWDSKAHFLPQIQFLAQSLWARELPWWNPFVFSGQPQIADPQSMIFSPPYMALALVDPSPGPWAQDVTLLASMAFGGVGVIVWFRDKAWHWAGAMIAALVFTFGAAMAWRIQHTGQVLSLAYLPWALMLLDRAVERGSVGAGAGAGLVAAFIVLGRDQIALLAVYLLAARTLWLWLEAENRWSRLQSSLLPLLAGGIVGLAAITLPVLMTVLLAADSNRPAIDLAGAGAGSLHPAHLVTLVVPQLFGAAGDMADYWGPPSFAWVGTGLYTAQNVGQCYLGAIPFLLLAGAAASTRLWDRDIRFFTVAFVFAVLYALGWYTPLFRAFYMLPGVDLYRRPADAVFMIGGLGAILAGYAAHVWFSEPWKRPSPPAVVGVAVLLILAAVVSLVFALVIDRVPRLPSPLALAAISFLAAGTAMAWAAPRVALQPWYAAIALVAVTAADLGYNNGPSTSSSLPPATFAMLDPAGGDPIVAAIKSRVVDNGTRRDRVELAGLGFHWPNASMTHRLENTLGYNPVRLGIYSRATGAEDHVGLPDQRKFSPLFPSYGSLLADMLGLRWIATGAPIETMDKHLRPGALVLVERVGGAYLYENPNALPRVMFATSARLADFEQILATGRWPDGFDPASTVLLRALPREGSAARPGKALIRQYGQTRIAIEVSSPDGGWVVLNDVWHPWWYAEIDGTPAPIEQANVIFRAVRVPSGRHSVVMTFRPLAGAWEELASRFTRGR